MLVADTVNKLPVRTLTRADLTVRKRLSIVDKSRIHASSCLTLCGPAGLRLQVATNDRRIFQLLSTFFYASRDRPELGTLLIITRSHRRDFRIDPESGAIHLSGPRVPLTLVKAAYRWLLAFHCWRSRLSLLPLHAVVLEGPRGAAAILGRSRSGKSYLSGVVLQQLPQLRIVSDDWGLLNTATLEYWRSAERYHHVRATDLSPRQRLAARLVERTMSPALVAEARFLVPSSLPEHAATPLRAVVALWRGAGGADCSGEQSPRLRLRMEFERHLYDDSLAYLPREACDWFLGLFDLLRGVHFRAEPSAAGPGGCYDAASHDCIRFVARYTVG